jgi:hypothetical protein
MQGALGSRAVLHAWEAEAGRPAYSFDTLSHPSEVRLRPALDYLLAEQLWKVE